jgi:hypothetical protein
MNDIINGTLTMHSSAGKHYLKGFTKKDWNNLKFVAKRLYKIKTKRNRILKKYVKKLLNDAIMNHISKEPKNG